MNKAIHILGAGGHTRSLITLLRHMNYNVEGIYDDTYDATIEETILDVRLVGKEDKIDHTLNLVLSIGDNIKRAQKFEQYESIVLKENIIHPSAIIEDYCQIKYANQIFAGVTINSGSSVGYNNILNTKCIIEHENVIGNHNHISIGSILGGRVKIGNRCFIGAGATIIDGICVCDDVIIGANATVISNISKPGTYVGSPIKKVK